MTIAIKPTASGSTIEQNGSTILTVDGSGNITPTNGLYSKVPTFGGYYVGSGQSIATATFTKLEINTEEWDTNSSFDSATNYRFTPTVAGYYQVNGHVAFSASVTAPQMSIYKNGAREKDGNNADSGIWATVSALVYLNGSTDYIELYVAHVTGTTQTTQTTALGNTRRTYFQAVLASV